MGRLLYGDLTAKIIGAAFTVHNALGPNLTEHVYKNAMILELRRLGLRVEVEKEALLRFAGVEVGHQRLDILVEERIIVETKAIRRTSSDHVRKLLGTMRNTGYQLGLIINFGESVQVKRVINSVQNK